MIPFTYDAYAALLRLVAQEGYTFTDYHACGSVQKPCILRHDVDVDINKAVVMATLERDMQVRSTYFVLLRSPFYNVFLSRTKEALQAIQNMGHEIGLHFDEVQYLAQEHNAARMTENILREIEAMQIALEGPVRTVSMHRPSRETLHADLLIPGIVNSYGSLFLLDYKYVTDSRMHWREDVRAVVKSGQYERLHLLTHPFCYEEREEPVRQQLLAFIRAGTIVRYEALRENFRNLDEYVRVEDVTEK